ncbi:MAG: hypothetical protein ACI4FY_09330 [Acetatifactor sp.]
MGFLDFLKPSAASVPENNKVFHLAAEGEFEHVYRFFVLFGAYNEDEYTVVHVDAYTVDSGAYKKGDVILRIAGYTNSSLVIKNYSRSVYQYLFSNLSSNSFSKEVRFHEPDCYVFNCPRDVFAEEVKEYAPNGRLDSYSVYSNRISLSVKFQRTGDDTDAWDKFKSYCDIWLH